MTVIITVHGTGSENENDRGDQWWQNGSAFQGELQTYIHGQDIKFEPFHWNGVNGEYDRRNAGTALARRISELEKEGTDYVLVGHSHGGSVIHHALFYLSCKNRELNHLKKWITVGTPFIEYRWMPFSLSRYNIIGQITLFAIFTGMLGVYNVSPMGRISENLKAYGSVFAGEGISDPFYASNLMTSPLIGLMVAVIALFAVRSSTSQARKRSSRKFQRRFFDRYIPLHTGLYHPDDEAIAALGNAENIKPLIIPFPTIKKIIRNALLLFSAVIVTAHFVVKSPALYQLGFKPKGDRIEFPVDGKDTSCLTDWQGRMRILIASTQNTLATVARGLERPQFIVCHISGQPEASGHPETSGQPVIHKVSPDDRISMAPATLGERILILPGVISAISTQIIYLGLSGWDTGKAPPTNFLIVRSMANLVSGPGLFVLMGGLFWGISFLLTRTLGRLAVMLANVKLAQRLRNISYGNDTYGEEVSHVSATFTMDKDDPFWKPLPEELANEIENFTEIHAINAIQRIRSIISNAARNNAMAFEADISDVLDWKELIHTAYFDISNFNRLLALAIIDSGLASAAPALQDNPDIKKIEAYYDAIKP